METKKFEEKINYGRGYFLLEDIPALKEKIEFLVDEYKHEEAFVFHGMYVYPEFAIKVIQHFDSDYKPPYD